MTTKATIWFYALKEVVTWCVPKDVQVEVLEKLMAEVQRKPFVGARLLSEIPEDKTYIKYHDEIYDAVSLMVQVMVRSIKINHSSDDAAKILYKHHRFGKGGGYMLDYLPKVRKM